MAFLEILTAIAMASSASAEKLKPLTHASIAAKEKVGGRRFGGISGLTYKDGKVWMLSDDRGGYGPNRVYHGTLTYEKSVLKVESADFVVLKKTKFLEDEKQVLDPEGFALLPDGDMLVSTEADTNLKPRSWNRLLRYSADGAYVADYEFPLAVQPERLGQQKTGTVNNSGPEGLSRCDDGSLWTGIERPLIGGKDGKVLIHRWAEDKGSFKVAETFEYTLGSTKAIFVEALRGISEVLCINDHELYVMERAAAFGDMGMTFDGEVYRARCEKGSCKKEKVLDFQDDLQKFMDTKKTPNYEALSWGPVLPNGKKTVIMASDNNFSDKDATEFVLLTVEE